MSVSVPRPVLYSILGLSLGAIAALLMKKKVSYKATGICPICALETGLGESGYCQSCEQDLAEVKGEKLEREKMASPEHCAPVLESESKRINEDMKRLYERTQLGDVSDPELARGKQIEMEHLPTMLRIRDSCFSDSGERGVVKMDNKDMSESISLDHLSELPDYYTRLDKMEQEAKGDMLEGPEYEHEDREEYGAPKAPSKADIKKLMAVMKKAKAIPKPKGWDAQWNSKYWPKCRKIVKAIKAGIAWSYALNPFTALIGVPVLIAEKNVKHIKELEDSGIEKLGSVGGDVIGRLVQLCAIWDANGRDTKKTMRDIQSLYFGVIAAPDVSIDWEKVDTSKLISGSMLILDTIAGYGAAGGGAAAATTGVGTPAAIAGGAVATAAQADDLLAFKLLADSVKESIVLKNKPAPPPA